ncbi:MAG: LLM class flavin-dependent oxidoreductase [Candidatus Dormibacteraeota bacterium]|nr:LLM class flavin-dependent oxidoreductase [Candidatus Dormibacteraeota bacterium]
MTGRSLAFGVLTFQALTYAELRSDAQFAERIGLDAVWLADQAVPDRLSILEAWTALSALAANTERIRIGTLITNVAMRNPMLLARQALTVDQVSGGRLDVGIGAGYYEDDHRWLGIDYLDGAGRVQRLTEVAEVLDRALRGERVTYSGAHVRLDDAPSVLPVQLPRPPIWIAVHGAKSLRLAARLADGVASVGDEGVGLEETLPRFRERMERLDDFCVAQGRDPRSVRRCYLAGFAEEHVFSSPESAAAFIGRFAEAGATDFVFGLANQTQPAFERGVTSGQFATREKLERLVADVLPKIRS